MACRVVLFPRKTSRITGGDHAMPCEVCSHTVQSIGKMSDGRPIHWCPRCGTIHAEIGPGKFVPTLVDLVRAARKADRPAGPIRGMPSIPSDLWAAIREAAGV